MRTTTSTLGTRVGGGVIAGILGGAVLSALLLVMNAAMGRDIWMALKGAGAPFLGERAHQPGFDGAAIALGVLCHFAVSIGWGVLFGLLCFGLSKPLTVVAGAFFGIVVWVGMYYVLLPAVGLGQAASSQPIATAILTHVLFGLVVGLGFLPFQQPRLTTRNPPTDRPVLARHSHQRH
jgi:hypothetical protein